MVSTIIIEPRYQETDQMGVIHHSVYPIWYEMGRIQFCKDMGYPFHEIEQKKIGLAMIHLECQYIRPTYFGQMYTLETSLIELGRVKMTFTYVIKDRSNHIVHQGRTQLAWLSEHFLPLDIKKHHQDVYDTFKKHVTIN